jgi:hypothetical protein
VPLISRSLVGSAGANSTKFSSFIIFAVIARERPSPMPITITTMMVRKANNLIKRAETNPFPLLRPMYTA